MLSGILAAHPFHTTLTGDDSLRRRPMRRIIEPLERMGARFTSTDGRPPLTIEGTARPVSIAFEPQIPSAQVKSAVILAGLHADGTTSVREPLPTRDHTERALQAFGASVGRSGSLVTINGGQRLVARDLTVPADISSAAFWMVAASALPGSEVVIEEVGLNPTRTAILDVLRRFGARVDAGGADEGDPGEPMGTIVVQHDTLREITIAPEEVPGVKRCRA
jgi:3-phosphoshikimate 1-carboxyvinyltransferase